MIWISWWRWTHSANLRERGTRLERTVKVCVRLLGRRVAMALVALIAGYFWMAHGARRAYSRAYLQRVFALSARKPPTARDTYQHFRSFAEKALDVFIAWLNPGQIGAITLASPDVVARANAGGRGALLIVSDHGNAEVSRVCLSSQIKDNHLSAGPHAARAAVQCVPARGAAGTCHHNHRSRGYRAGLAVQLKERVERGEWIAIAGDRTPFRARRAPWPCLFLAAPRRFRPDPISSPRSWNARSTCCPAFATALDIAWRSNFSRKRSSFRAVREAAIAAYAARYAQWLEAQCLAYPYQFYNFYDFWSAEELAEQSRASQAA